ncbi:zinc ribbon domain-containing protein [Rahnella aquatilis]|nr:zinc ribbon domain-containing protein [Rahnella aquatilis]
MELLIIAAVLGLIPAFIAQSKGRSFGAWWLYGFLLFIVAIIHVLIIPSLHNPSVKSSELRECPFCAEPIKRQASKCKHCGSEVSPLPSLVEIHGDGTKISWKRVGVLVLSIAVTLVIIRLFGVK